MNKFGQSIRKQREAKGLLLRQLASAIEVDTAMMSKIERGERNAKRHQVKILAGLLGLDTKQLLTFWLADKIYDVVRGEELAGEALKVAEEEVQYKVLSKTDNK